MDDNLLTFTGGSVMAVLGYFLKGAHKEAKTALQKSTDNELALEKYKNEASKEFANKEDMRNTLSRIHERLDNLPSEIVHLIKAK